MKSEFGTFLDGIIGLALSGGAAALSATVVKADLLPDKLQWLGAAGAVVAACALLLGFVMRPCIIGRTSRILMFLLVAALVGVVVLRGVAVEEISYGGQAHRFLKGFGLSSTGEIMKQNCLLNTGRKVNDTLSDYELIRCVGPDRIPELYRWPTVLSLLYVFVYLLLLAVFSMLVASIQLSNRADHSTAAL